MGVVTGAVIAGTAALGAAKMQSDAASKASSTSKKAANAAIDASQTNYNNTAANLDPYISAGTNALSQMQAVNSGDYSGFENSPDYQFSLTQGLQGLDRSAASRGSLYSGGQSADVLNYAQGLASQNLNTYYNRLQNLSSQGQSAASNLGSVGTGNAASIGNYLTNSANASNSATATSTNANVNALSTLAQLAGQLGTNTPQTATQSSYLSTSTPYTGAGSTGIGWSGSGTNNYNVNR